jgi:hypothetical protein
MDITEAQLLPIGVALHGPTVRHCRLEGSESLKRGGCGDKVLGELVATTSEGGEIRTPLFIKKFNWTGKSEAAHYRHLAACSVPIPRQYGTVQHPDGDEILFMERLTEIGFNRHSEAEWRQMLTLLAQLNACAVTPDYLSHLHPFEQGGRIDGYWITGYNNPFPPTPEQIEENLRACGVAESEHSELCRAALRLCERVNALPRGLVHQDFLQDNLGWRGERAEMVVFDVHKNALAPRFADAAAFLGLPDWSYTAPFLDEAPTRREALITLYLEAYAQFGGGHISLETFYEEAALLVWANKLAVLWWIAEQKQTERIEQVLAYLRTC